MKKRLSILLLLIYIFVSSAEVTAKISQVDDSLYRKRYVKEMMLKVFNWQVNNPVVSNAKYVDDWARAVFYSGIMRAYKSTKNKA